MTGTNITGLNSGKEVAQCFADLVMCILWNNGSLTYLQWRSWLGMGLNFSLLENGKQVP